MIVIMMGVSGSGKTTVGGLLAHRLNWQFYDGDNFHTAENIEKMSRGIPLTDGDRMPWLRRVRDVIEQCCRSGTSAVIACSALRQSYRSCLLDGVDGDLRLVYLKGDYETMLGRIGERSEHFMKQSMLDSQYRALEEPADAIVADVTETPEIIVARIEAALFSSCNEGRR